MAELWQEKYSPQTAEEFVGNSEILENALSWAGNWNKGQVQAPLLLWGQIGSGKTSLAYLIGKLSGWDVVELNSSDLRSKDVIERVVGAASQNASFFGSKRLILLDEVDALTRNDRGGAAAISAVIKDAKNPIILTANDIYANKNVSALRFVCRTFEFKKINYLSIAKHLREILEKEGVEFDEDAIKELAKNSVGDMRSALLDSQTLSFEGKISQEDVALLSPRERQQKVFAVMKAIFKGTNFADVREARSKSDLAN
ncbi:MAG: AAA family ATPase, partial [archaeon]|nr:AAA family ATPase [archaeon]